MATLSTVPRAGDRATEPRATEAILRVVYPRGLEQSLSIGASAVVGRRPGAGGLAIPHSTVSREHLALVWDKVWLCHVAVDRASYNGTRIDGVAIEPGERVALASGALLQLGDVLAVYERVSGASEDPESVSREAVPGSAAATRQLRTAVARAATDPAPVLLVGQTGTGKEHIARELHRLSGRRGAWIPVNCAALSPELIESQLFGHVRGAFTGATAARDGFFRAAEGGTLFLDEIGDLPVELQAKLLRAIQEREVHPVGSSQTVPVDVRIIAATNRDLAVAVEAGEFRRDLYARLALWEIAAPSLRERRPDILSWLDILCLVWRSERGLADADAISLSPEAAEMIALHDWPDNLRGLRRLLHAIEASGSGAGEIVSADRLPGWIRDRAVVATCRTRVRRKSPGRDELAGVFTELEGNVSATARHFGRDRKQIYRWLDAYGLR